MGSPGDRSDRPLAVVADAAPIQAQLAREGVRVGRKRVARLMREAGLRGASRGRIVGWAMSNHLYTELMIRALDMALLQRRPAQVIHHSDQGCQYTSIAFGRRRREAGVQPSMGTAGDAYDNAM